MKAWRSACVCVFFLGLISGLGQAMQSKWMTLPTVPLGPNDPDLIGAAVGATAKRGGLESSALVFISVAKKWGTADIGVLIKDLSKLISEKDLWPYTGPDLGREAMNPRMMEVTLISPRGEAHFESRMIMSSSGNFPKGLINDEDQLFATNCAMDRRFIALLAEMKEGFDYGVVQIGRGVFSPAIEVRFGGQNVKNALEPVMRYIKEQK